MSLKYRSIAIDTDSEFMAINKTAINVFKSQGGSNHLPIIGGKIIEFIKSLFDCCGDRKLSVFVHKKRRV